MSKKQFAKASLAAFLVYLAVHLVGHRVLFAGFFETHLFSLMKGTPPKALALATLLAFPISMAFLVVKGASEERPLRDGLLLGGVIGLMSILALGTVFVGYVGASISLLWVDVPLHVFEGALVGLVASGIFHRSFFPRAGTAMVAEAHSTM
jgi:hypothetical protein